METTGLLQTTGLLLAGQDMPASTEQTFERTGPVNSEPVTRAAAASQQDAHRAVDLAARAFPQWSATTPEHRRDVLIQAGNALVSRTDDFVQIMSEETGATPAWARFNVTLASQMLLHAATLPEQIVNQPIASNQEGRRAMAVRRAAGVVFAMAPWNAPVILGVRSIAAPLACGNTVVMKSSELCPRTHRLIAETLIGAGIPGAALNLISSAPADANALVDAIIGHPAVRRVNFTGSTRAGRIVAQICATHLKPALLELSGKAPLVVLDDADIDTAVDCAHFGAFVNQGQICMSTERCIVHHGIADQFTDLLRQKIEQSNALEASNESSTFGRMVDLRATQRLAGLINDALSKGASLQAGGQIDGARMQATLLSDVTPSMRIYTEEIFGPIACVIRADGDDEAVRIANDTDYGLAASVFSGDTERAMRVAQRIESGICHINGPTVHDEPQMPFGGVKASGYGRFGGTSGIDEFTELRWITVQESPVQESTNPL